MSEFATVHDAIVLGVLLGIGLIATAAILTIQIECLDNRLSRLEKRLDEERRKGERG